MILSIEMYNIFLLKHFPRKLDLSFLVIFFFFTSDRGILPNVLFGIMWNLSIFIMLHELSILVDRVLGNLQVVCFICYLKQFFVIL